MPASFSSLGRLSNCHRLPEATAAFTFQLGQGPGSELLYSPLLIFLWPVWVSIFPTALGALDKAAAESILVPRTQRLSWRPVLPGSAGLSFRGNQNSGGLNCLPEILGVLNGAQSNQDLGIGL